MDFINDIKSETLIICNSYVKELILKENKLIPIKFMNPLEFLSEYYFTYDENAIIYVMDKYNIKYDIAKEYIDNLYYVENKKYEIAKLDFLVNLKTELDFHKLLIYSNNFHEYLKRVKIIIYDIDMNNFLYKTLSGLNYEIITRKYHNYNHKVYEFDSMEDEVNYIAFNICKLIDNGINPNMIKLTNVSPDYYNTLVRIFSLYNLKVNIPYQTSLVNYPLVKEFIKSYKDSSKSIEEILLELDNDSNVYLELVKVINKYLKYDNKGLLIYKIANSTINSYPYENGIDIVDYLDYISDENEYVFMMGFNEGIIPKNNMDTAYITDNICALLGLDTTRILNKKLKDKTINIINDIKNLTITYKLKDFKKSYYPSTLIANYEVSRIDENNKDSYSEVSDKIKLVKAYDDYFKYGYKCKEFDVLNNNYKISYNSYDNKFKGIDSVMDKLNLSYSKMQTYNKCAFRYYLSNILKLDIFEENFTTVIGSMVHYVMEKCLTNNDMETDKYVKEYLKDKVFSKKEQFFLEKYQECLKELLDQILVEREYVLFNKAMYEKRIDIDYGNNIHFVGIIDKVLYYTDNDITYVALIDYKTGNDNISLKYLKYGLDIQLPIYLYLSTKLDFKNVKYVGFYLQKFDITSKDYRLVGYSNSDRDTLSVIDKNYDNSKIIKGLKTNKDGSFSKNSKVLSDAEIEKVKNKTEDIIKEVIDKIRCNDFPINPKVSNGINIGCEYCKFKDICFKKIADETEIYETELENV